MQTTLPQHTSSNASLNIPTSTSVQTTTLSPNPRGEPPLRPRLPCPPRESVLSHKFQKLFRELRPREWCFPLVENSNSDDVVFCRSDAEAEKYVALDVAETAPCKGLDRGEGRGEVQREILWGVQVCAELLAGGSKILSWEEERFSTGVAKGLKKVGLEVVVTILSCEKVLCNPGGDDSIIPGDSIPRSHADNALNRSCRLSEERVLVETLLAVIGGVGNSLKNLA